MFISIPRWWLSSFDPVPCPPENETASHDQTRATRRDATIYRASIIAIPVDIHSALLSPFFPPLSPPLERTGPVKPRAFRRKSKGRAATWASRIPYAIVARSIEDGYYQRERERFLIYEFDLLKGLEATKS